MNGDESKPLILNSTTHQPVFEGVLLCTVLGVPLVYFGFVFLCQSYSLMKYKQIVIGFFTI